MASFIFVIADMFAIPAGDEAAGIEGIDGIVVAAGVCWARAAGIDTGPAATASTMAAIRVLRGEDMVLFLVSGGGVLVWHAAIIRRITLATGSGLCVAAMPTRFQRGKRQ